MPHSRHSRRSPSIAFAVRATIGNRRQDAAFIDSEIPGWAFAKAGIGRYLKLPGLLAAQYQCFARKIHRIFMRAGKMPRKKCVGFQIEPRMIGKHQFAGKAKIEERICSSAATRPQPHTHHQSQSQGHQPHRPRFRHRRHHQTPTHQLPLLPVIHIRQKQRPLTARIIPDK